MKITIKHYKIPFGPYFAGMNANPDFCTRLLKTGKKLTQRFHKELAGHIHHEYNYDLKKHSWIKEEFKIYINTWIHGFEQFRGGEKFNPPYKLKSIWINFQKSGEYNPVHTHPDCALSFVLYLEVPRKMLEEKRSTMRGIPPGHTGFIYGERTPGVVSERVIKPEEGMLYMFPAYLRHYVTHFNSKVTRTTVSGNITF